MGSGDAGTSAYIIQKPVSARIPWKEGEPLALPTDSGAATPSPVSWSLKGSGGAMGEQHVTALPLTSHRAVMVLVTLLITHLMEIGEVLSGTTYRTCAVRSV